MSVRIGLGLANYPFSNPRAFWRWVERERLSVLLVTHDLEEALSLSDVVHVLSQGPRARIRSSYEVPIPRPRDLKAARLHPAFPRLLERLWQDMDEEVSGIREAAE
jgi:NitT/TauT family transport system ATP-binding protein